MKFPQPLRQLFPRSLPAIAATLLIPLASGCASPGPPRPPTLNLPTIVPDLTADRSADNVTLHWTTPTKTTDELAITGPITAEICRITPPASACVPTQRLPVRPGPSQTTEALPQPLTADPVALLTYRVQLFNSNNRSSGPSPDAFVAAGAAPPPVAQLQATPSGSGATLQWQPQPSSSIIELDRLLTSAPTPKPAAAKPAKQPLTLTTPTEVKLHTPNQPSDPGGTFDRTVQKGETYTYTAQRVRSVTIDGHTLELRSASSPPITVNMRDTFPPNAPTGLEAVPEGPTSIDLSWEPNTEPDLAGYFVYRQSVTPAGALEGTPSRLTPTPAPGPAFRDTTASPGHRYSYFVTAVDTSGNESAFSASVEETLPEPQAP